MVTGTVEQHVIGGQAEVQAAAEAVLENQRENMHLEHTKNATREALASIRRKKDKSSKSWYVLGQESMLLLPKGAVEDHLKAEQKEQNKATEQLRVEKLERLDKLYKLAPEITKIPRPAAELLLKHNKQPEKAKSSKESPSEDKKATSKSEEKKDAAPAKPQQKPDRLDYSRWDKMDFSDSDESDDLVDDGSDTCMADEFVSEEDIMKMNDLRELVPN